MFSAEKIPSSIVHWYLERKHPCTLKKLVTLPPCTESCDIPLHLIKRLFNKSKKRMTRDSILHSHISVSQCHSLVERRFQYLLAGLQKEKDKKNLMYFVFSYTLFFKREEEFYFTSSFVTKGVD